MRKNKFIACVLLLSMGLIFLESCASGKKGCGCGADINRAYKTSKKFH
jgi:hypothetical protein